jgi:four helix bundle protein
MSNDEIRMTNDGIVDAEKKREFDLEERTATFSEQVIDFVHGLPKTVVTIPLIDQLVRSATSVGANYMEADSAPTKKDFCYKISLCRKEAKETFYWLRLLARAIPDRVSSCQKLGQEAKELTLIFSAIFRSSQNK